MKALWYFILRTPDFRTGIISALFFASITGCALPLSAHTFFEGLTEISYNARTDSTEIIQRYTTHDFEVLLAEKNQQKVSADQNDYENLLRRYTNRHFSLVKYQTPLKINWIGIEAGINETVIYQEIPGLKSLNQLTITNQMLIDFFPAQLNRVNYSMPDAKGTLIFTEDNTRQALPALNPSK